MKILFFTYDFPYPTTSGGKMRAYNLIKEKSSDIDMTLFSFVREGFGTHYIDHMADLGVKDVRVFRRRRVKDPKNIVGILHPEWSIFKSLYYSKSVHDELVEYIKDNKIDLVHFESYYTAFYISKAIKNLGVRQLFGTENIEQILYRDYIKYNVPRAFSPLYVHQWKKIKKEEENMFHHADAVLSVTQEEKEHIERYAKNSVHVIPNGVNTQQFSYEPKKSTGGKLLFIGNFSYFPNVDGIEHFYKNVFSHLPKDMTLTIIGKNPQKLSFFNDTRIIFKEFVEDVVAEYHNADIFLSPIRIGGGTNFKILEAMSCGLPVVMSPHRIKGIGIENRKHALVAENAGEYTKAIEQLLTNDDLRHKLTKHARELIESKYDWKIIGKKMNEVWKGL